MPNLFEPIKIGSIQARNRVFMAALTRARATKEGVPTDLMATYYGQRASAGLITSEATGISRAGLGWPYAPGIWTDAQVNKWKDVTDAVHSKGGKILSQLWHMGRASPSGVTGLQSLSASATTYPSKMFVFDGMADPETAKEMTVEEIQSTVKDFAEAAKNAIRAGFDGVQIHGGNGYLIDQFLRDSTNKRTDNYGGSIENRVRFLAEVTDAVVDAVGAERTTVRLSPNGDSLGVIDSDPEPLFTHAAKVLNDKKVAMVELREEGPEKQVQVHDAVRKAYKGVLVLNQGYDKQSATEALDSGKADAIAFGRNFIGNPDYPDKLKNDKKLRGFSYEFAYTQGPEGYIDFPEGSPE